MTQVKLNQGKINNQVNNQDQCTPLSTQKTNNIKGKSGNKILSPCVAWTLSLSKEDRSKYFQIKRLSEWYAGCAELRDQIRENTVSEKYFQLMEEIGVSRECTSKMVELWSDKRQCSEFDNIVSNPNDFTRESVSKSFDSFLQGNRYADLFLAFNVIKARSTLAHHDWSLNIFNGDSTYFDWRKRRIKSVRSETGEYGYGIDHPTFAVELGIGCTVQCNFCAFAAEKHKENFDFTDLENQKLMRALASAFEQVMGAGVGGGMLYYATEPNDNPNYVDFVNLWYEETGWKLCTSSARYDIEWIQKLTEFYGSPTPMMWPRLSVLSRHYMEKIHRHFTPEELGYPWLLAQQVEVEDERAKVPGGREKHGLKKLKEVRDCRFYDTPEEVDLESIPQGSIACVTGFKVNMINKTITATSPCYTSEKWPLGYRNYGTIDFTTPNSILPALKQLVNRVMLKTLPNNAPIRLRDDLQLRIKGSGFWLVSPCHFHEFTNHTFYTHLGAILELNNKRQVPWTKSEFINELIKRLPDQSPMAVAVFFEKFFNAGYIDETFLSDPAWEL